MLVCSGCGATSEPALTAQSIAFGSHDVPGVTSCPSTGSFDHFLTRQRTVSEGTYSDGQFVWQVLTASGALDAFVAAWAENPSDCKIFNSDTNPRGRVYYVAAVHYRSASGAASSFKTDVGVLATSSLDPSGFAQDGTAVQGDATGLGATSFEGDATYDGSPRFEAVWQRNNFVMSIVGRGVTLGDGEKLARKVDSRAR